MWQCALKIATCSVTLFQIMSSLVTASEDAPITEKETITQLVKMIVDLCKLGAGKILMSQSHSSTNYSP